jgi:hypothetical protein
MRTYRGVIIVTHEGEVHKDELIQHLTETTVLEIHECEIDGLQVVILWRSLIDMDEVLET